ncbi:hypothetical protein, partial [Streptomyces sp. MBT98]|uniref:hypothetical protein n=1 Tax=Streptomyces sp. MBT98 TaxID=2800412 RepID=UPI001F39D6C1
RGGGEGRGRGEGWRPRQGVGAPPSVVADAVGGVVPVLVLVLVLVRVGGPPGSVVRPDGPSVPALPGTVLLGGSVGRPSDGAGDG